MTQPRFGRVLTAMITPFAEDGSLDLEGAVAAAVEEFGRLDCLVHNAVGGSAAPGPLEGIGDGWRGLLATTVRASFDTAQVAHPHLAAAGGSLVFLTSAAGMEGSANLPAYAMVKASQRALAKSLSREWGSDGIRVNCIAPVAMTPAMARAYAANPELEERLVERDGPHRHAAQRVPGHDFRSRGRRRSENAAGARHLETGGASCGRRCGRGG